MQKFLPELIQLNIPFIFLLLIGVVAASIAYYLYRNSTPEISKFSKYLLVTIRGIIFFFVILIFFSPSFFLTFKETIKPKIALFIDNSKSMGYEDDDHDRWSILKKTTKTLLEILPQNTDLIQFTFNNALDTLSKSEIPLSDRSTDFKPLIKLLKKENFDKAIIISDGNHTESGYPIEHEWPYNSKIYTVGIGLTSSGTDIAISDVTYQPVIYADQENSIAVQIRTESLNYNPNVQLKYYLNDKLIQKKNINLHPGSFNTNVNLSNISANVGLNKIRLEVDAIEEETNILNNKYTFVQNVMNSRIKISIFSGAPSYESKFLSFLLNKNENFEIYNFVEKKNGQFYEQINLNDLDQSDVLIFCGFPGHNTTVNTQNRILNYLRQNQPSLLFYLNEHTNQKKLLELRTWLPYQQLPGKIKSREILINNPLTISVNPILFIFEQKNTNQEFWSKVPPITVQYSGGLIRDGVKSLLEGSDSQNQFPIILLNDQTNYRSAVLNGEGFWKWHFLLQNNQGISNGYQKFLLNILLWVNDRTKLKPVILNSEKNVVYLGEIVKIIGNIYDASFKPIRDGELIVQSKWNQQEFNIDVDNDSTGNYLIKFVPPGEGKYTISAKGFKEGIELGSDFVELEVIPIEKEFIHIDQNVEFLKKIAAMGNGFYVDASDVDSLASALVEPDKTRLKDRIIDVWYHPVLLILIILLITAEWIIRKRLGLV